MNPNSFGTSPNDCLTLGDSLTQVTPGTDYTVLQCAIQLTYVIEDYKVYADYHRTATIYTQVLLGLFNFS